MLKRFEVIVDPSKGTGMTVEAEWYDVQDGFLVFHGRLDERIGTFKEWTCVLEIRDQRGPVVLSHAEEVAA